MKKFLLLSTSCFSMFTGFSQIVIEVADFPQANDSIYQGTDTLVPVSITPGSAGANQTWDFSQLRTRQGNTIHFADPATISSGANFPTAFIAVEQFGGWGFADSANGVVEITGFSGDFSGFGLNLDVHFQNPQTIFEFPSTYQGSYTDTSVIDVKMEAPPGLIPIPGIDSIHFKRFSDIASEIDGYGTVITPLQSYQALRQRNVEHNIDSVWAHGFGTWFLVPSQSGFQNPSDKMAHRYNYIIKEIGYYAVSLSATVTDSISSATFVSDPAQCCFGAGINETNISEAFSIYPNPANDQFVISMDKPG